MQAVLEKQSYILLSRNDVESLMRLEPANISLQTSTSQPENNVTDAEAAEVEIELSDLLLDMCPIKQVCLLFFKFVEYFFQFFMKEDVARVIGRLINERAMPEYIYRQG